MSYNKILGIGNYNLSNSFTQLIAPGNTSAVNVEGLRNHTFSINVAAINTNVIVKVQGSLDGTNFFTLPVDSQNAVGNMSVSINEATITSNGIYGLFVKNIEIKNIRLVFISESGGTAATIDAIYLGSN